MEKTELNINLMLFSWGLISGETTKFGWLKPLSVFLLNLYFPIKWSILMFYHPINHYLGDFAYFSGQN